jgi:SAM-dependent methyltransferase
MRITPSGDYKLPTPFQCLAGNLALRNARFVPPVLRNKFMERHTGYQVFGDKEIGASEGVSHKKWEALRMPRELKGASVLDIGCAEGFFCRQSAASGAGPVVGIDTSVTRLMCASFVSLKEKLNISYRMAVFPKLATRAKYAYIICLSVLHHSLACKDIWKVLTVPECKSDLLILQQQLRFLRSLNLDGGKCIIEMPYEYDDPAERKVVDFDRFSAELTKAGFAKAKCLGSWDYNPQYQQIKDRLIYVAEA